MHDVSRLDLFLTEACNLSCNYCFAADAKPGAISTTKAREGIAWLMKSRSQKVHITFWGGEPFLLWKMLKQCVAEAKSAATDCGKSIGFSIPTNATLLDEEKLNWVAENGIKIFLSIDGAASAQAFRPLRSGENSHTLATEGLRQALRHKNLPAPAVRMTVSPQNVTALVESVVHFVGEGVSELLIYPAYDSPWTETELKRFETVQNQLVEKVIELFGTLGHRSVPQLKAWRPILRRLYREGHGRPRQGPVNHCGAGIQLEARTTALEASPCHRFVFYNRQRPQALKAGDFADLRIEAFQGKTRCVECSEFDLCTYGCVAINFATTGNLKRIPTVACALMTAQIAACKKLHNTLSNDPNYALYLGIPIKSVLQKKARALAHKAWQDYSSTGAPG
jgi:uncharacterized protein